ncbi:MAG: complex I subunit 5 family protein [Desulfurococcaceae archaeon]|nr:complex I subunit 5 family protein [Sulfolobales archaeon]MDW8169680.1 complex I subunit 5 family protein [Desulfurococcaceae archaeon]
MYWRYVYWTTLSTVMALSYMLHERSRLRTLLKLAAFNMVWLFTSLGFIELTKAQLVFLALSSVASVAISIYSEGYFKSMYGKFASLNSRVDLTLILIQMFFTSQNLIELTTLWIAVELMGFILILMEKGVENLSVGLKYLLICATAGDISLFTMLGLVAVNTGISGAASMSLQELSYLGIRADPLITLLLIMGFAAKLAQIPLHAWLIDTYSESPAITAAILSGLSSKMAVYGLIVCCYMFNLDTLVFSGALTSMGIISAIYGVLMSIAQRDYRRLLAYSSLSYYGVLAVIAALIPLFGAETLDLLLTYSLYHGLTKALLFLNAGSVEYITNTRDIYRLGFVGRSSRELFMPALLGFLSLIGMPPTLGFLSKFLALHYSLKLLLMGFMASMPLLITIVITSVFGIAYSVKYFSIYTGSIAEKPMRPLVTVSWEQRLGEIMLSLSLIVLVAVCATCTAIELVVNYVFIASLVASAGGLAFISKAKYRESDVWLGGIEA